MTRGADTGKRERVRSAEAAKLLGVTATQLRGLIDRVEFPGMAKLGGMWTFDIKALAAYKRKRDAAPPKRPKLPPELKDTVYFVRSGMMIKIGYTRNLPARLNTLQTANGRDIELIASFDGTKAGERELHALFKAHHIRGEWFHDCRPIWRWVRQHRGALP